MSNGLYWQILRFNQLESAMHTEAEFLLPLFEKYVDESESFLCVRETGENGNNPHYHIAFASTAKTQSIRQWINRGAWKGNKNYSLKAGSEDLLERQFNYLLKGKCSDELPQVIKRSDNFDDAVVAERHKAYWVEHERLVVAGRKRKATTGLPIGEQIYEICARQSSAQSVGVSEDQVIEIAMRWYIQHKTSMSVYHITNVVNWVIGKLHTRQTLSDLGTDLFDSNRMEIFKQNCKLKLNTH